MAKIINNKIKFEVIRFVDSIGNQVDVEFDAAPDNINEINEIIASASRCAKQQKRAFKHLTSLNNYGLIRV